MLLNFTIQAPSTGFSSKLTISFLPIRKNVFTINIFFLGKNLKVRHPDKYNWDPKWLLSHLIDIYLHLDGPALDAAVANDQRSFSLDTFKVSLTDHRPVCSTHCWVKLINRHGWHVALTRKLYNLTWQLIPWLQGLMYSCLSWTWSLLSQTARAYWWLMTLNDSS